MALPTGVRLQRLSRRRAAAAVFVCLIATSRVEAQFPDLLSERECPGCSERFSDMAFEGVWSSSLTSSSDAAWALADFFCFSACSAEGFATAATLLSDEQRGALEIYPDVAAANIGTALRLLTPASRESTAARHAAEPFRAGAQSFGCDARGFAAQVVSPLPLRIELEPNRLVLHYEELGVERTVLLGEGARLAASSTTPLGVSQGRFENGVLIVETARISAGWLHEAFGGLPHSDALRAIERYTVSKDGRWLELELELDDPATLTAPLVVKKRLRRTPTAKILTYACDVMSSGLDNVFAEYLDPRKLDERRAQLRR